MWQSIISNNYAGLSGIKVKEVENRIYIRTMENTNCDLSILAVLAGCKSSRKGKAKALIPLLGKQLMERIACRPSQITGKIILAMDKNRVCIPPLAGNVVVDEVGLLSGFYSSFIAFDFPQGAGFARDVIFVNELIFKQLNRKCQDKKTDKAVPTSSRRLEPFHTVFCKESYIQVIQELIKKWNIGDKEIDQ